MELRLARAELDCAGDRQAGIAKIMRIKMRLSQQVVGFGVARILLRCFRKKLRGKTPTAFLQRQNTEIVVTPFMGWIETKSSKIIGFRFRLVSLSETKIAQCKIGFCVAGNVGVSELKLLLGQCQVVRLERLPA